MSRKMILPVFCLLVLAWPAPGHEGCFSIVAGKAATRDGGLLLGHNEDCSIQEFMGMRKVKARSHEKGESFTMPGGGRIPQPARTHGYWHLQMPRQQYCDAVLNRSGLVVFSNSCPSREDKPELTNGGIGGPQLRLLVAEQARTARQGVELIGRWVEQFGYTASGRTMIVADLKEAWLVSLVRGKHWAAGRVPDDRVAAIANTYTLGEIDLDDTENYRACPDVIDYAVERGWYDPSSGPFRFEAAYAAPGSRKHPSNLSRLWTVLLKLSGDPLPAPEPGRLPFCVKPIKPMTMEQFTSALRDHYEHTPVLADGVTSGYKEDSPHQGRVSTVCCPATNASSVFQLRDRGYIGVDVVWWYTLWQPCSSPYLPFYLGLDRVPEQLAFTEPQNPTRGSPACECFGRLARWVDEDYGKRIVPIRKRWSLMERSARDFQPELEKQVIHLLMQDQHDEAWEIMGAYCQGLAVRAMQQARELLE